MRLNYLRDDWQHRQIPGLERPYKLMLCHEEGYNDAKHKVLVVVQWVSSGDLTEKRLLGDETTHITYDNVLSYVKEYGRLLGGKTRDVKFAFVNFNDIKTVGLSRALESTAHKMFAERVDYWVDQLKPDTIFVFGDTAAKALLPKAKKKQAATKIPGLSYRGWKFKYKKKIPTYTTIDIDKAFTATGSADTLSDDAILSANLLGYVGRCLANAFIPKSTVKQLSAIDVKPNCDYVDTIEKFDALFKKLMKAQIISFDLESTDLSTLSNKILTLQFALDSKKGYLIPMYHKETPFSKKELMYIKKKIRKLFSIVMPKYSGMNTRFLIGANIGFDLRVVRHWLGLNYIYWPMWDVQGGDFLLDENLKGLTNYGTKYYNLANLLTAHGNDYYYTADFGKADRVTIKDVSLSNQGLRDYGAMDVQAPFRLYEIQMLTASFMRTEDGKPYTETYHRLHLVHLATIIRMQSIMRHRGTLVHHKYLTEIVKTDGPVAKRLIELSRELYEDEKVQEANSVFMKKEGIGGTGLFGAITARLINLAKSAHKKVLFQDVLELEPLEVSRKTGEPKYDKFFLKHYKDTHSCTDLMQRISQLEKIKSSFIKPFLAKLEEDLDSSVDHRIRPDFGYLLVVTGRSNSSGPSLQQIPEHSDDAKVVKEMFIVPEGCLHFEADYSAHEVRNWGILSGDQNIMLGFKKIHNFLQSFREKPTKKKKATLDGVADPHRQNYQTFTGIPAQDVSKEQRQDAKGITFGSMYGMSPNSLATQIKKAVEETKTIMANFFKKFHKAKSWLDSKVKSAQKNYFIMSPIGRRRNLFCMMSGHNAIVAAGERRAQNSEIQGFASDVGYLAADLYSQKLFECFNELNETSVLPCGPNAMVHDSLKCEERFKYVFLGIHLLEWAMTNGVQDLLDEVFGFRVGVCFEVEFAISGTSWAKKRTWKGPFESPSWEATKDDPLFNPEKPDKEFDIGSLEFCIREALKDHHKMWNNIPDIDAMYASMLKEYESQKKVLKLDKRFPLNTHMEKV